jgi:subtilase family protein
VKRRTLQMLEHVPPLRICIVAASLVTLAYANTSRGQPPPLGERQVLATFAEGSTILPDSANSGTVSDAINPSLDLADIMESFGVEEVARAFPDFNQADTLGTAFTGEPIRLMDWSKVWVLTMPVGTDIDAFLTSLRGSTSTLLAGPNGMGQSFAAPIYPNDPEFKSGAQWPLWSTAPGTPEQDINGAWAWGTTTGSPRVRTAIIDEGFTSGHPDLTGRVFGTNGSTADSAHAYAIAGVIGAATNNGIGIAGVDWLGGLVSRIGGGSTSFSTTVNAINFVSREPTGARIINASWGLRDHGVPVPDPFVKAALAEHHGRNGVTVCAMGNTGTNQVEFPAGYGNGIISVGAVNRFGQRWVDTSTGEGSSTGNHIDVVAPGVDVLTTTSDGGFAAVTGTSIATPFVSGVAALLLAADSTLNADDVENLIRLSADNLGTSGFDAEFGMGKVNASRALALLRPPNQLIHQTFTTSSPTVVGNFFYNNVTVMGLPSRPGVPAVLPNVYNVRQRRLSINVGYGPNVWGRGGAQLTTGYERFDNPYRILTDLRWCGPTTVGTNFATLETAVYEVPNGSGHWYPVHPDSPITFAWSALNVAPVPDAGNSFYVPQRGSTGTPIEGTAATSFFRACPNNDGGTSLPNNVRIKVVVKDAVGQPISGIQPTDIFILLNGGTPVQGFIGDGADSVVSDSTYNRPTPTYPQAPLCPVLRALNADAPTDGSGVTYITFTGSKPDSPGVAMREPSRKWGHFDTELPVYALGTKLQGRLTTASTNGSYSLQIKNYDFTYVGLGTAEAKGEAVTSSESGYVSNNIYPVTPNELTWWADFDNSGAVTSADFSQLMQHMTHDCDTPNNP